MLDVLVADDDPDVRESVGQALADRGHRVTEACDGAAAAGLLSCRVFDLAICDVRMPRIDGVALLRLIRREAPDTSVVVMTSFPAVRDAVTSLQDGATHYIAKPFDVDQFISRIVDPIDERRSVGRRLEAGRAGFVARSKGATLVAESPVMKALSDRIALLAQSEAPVLVSGEPGAGKDLVAWNLHAQGARRDGPLVFLEAALLPELMEAPVPPDLGFEHPRRDAWFRAASKGTLVIDAIDRLPQRAHAQLLRIVDDPATQARRGPSGEPLGVRVISLTRENLVPRVIAGEFPDLLYYRLSRVHLHVPALRHREEDLFPLVTELLRELTPRDATPPSLSPRAWRALVRHDYAANVRELRATIDQALALSHGQAVDLPHLPFTFADGETVTGR